MLQEDFSPTFQGHGLGWLRQHVHSQGMIGRRGLHNVKAAQNILLTVFPAARPVLVQITVRVLHEGGVDKSSIAL